MSRSGPVTKDTSTVALGLAQIRVGASAANIATIAPVLAASASIGALASTKFTGTVDYWKLESGFPMLEDYTIPIREAAMLECEFKEITPYNLALARGIDPATGTDTLTVGSVDVVTSTNTLVLAAAGIAIDATYGQEGQYIIEFSSATEYTVTHVAGGLMGDDGGVTISTVEEFNHDGSNTAITITGATFLVSGTPADGDIIHFSIYTASSTYTNPHSGSINLGALVAPDYVRMEAVYTYPNGINTMTIVFPRANCTTSVEIDLQAEDNANVPLTFEAKRADSDLVIGGNAVWDLSPIGRIVFT